MPDSAWGEGAGKIATTSFPPPLTHTHTHTLSQTLWLLGLRAPGSSEPAFQTPHHPSHPVLPRIPEASDHTPTTPHPGFDPACLCSVSPTQRPQPSFPPPHPGGQSPHWPGLPDLPLIREEISLPKSLLTHPPQGRLCLFLPRPSPATIKEDFLGPFPSTSSTFFLTGESKPKSFLPPHPHLPISSEQAGSLLCLQLTSQPTLPRYGCLHHSQRFICPAMCQALFWC